MTTIEEKAKAYDEALEKVKPLYKQAKKDDCPIWSVYEHLFPDLKESEDERITRAINNMLPFIPDEAYANNGVTKEGVLNWLEKQKEHVSIFDKFNGLKSLMLQYLQSAANRKNDTEIESDTDLWGRKILDYVWKQDEKQKEQKSTLVEKLRSISTPADENWFEIQKRWEKEDEQKPAEYLPKEKVYGIMTKLTELSSSQLIPINSPEYLKIHDITRDVRSLLDYPIKQKPAEWSEEYREEDLRTRFAFYTYKDEDSVLYLSNVFVEESSRNKGFGTKILAAAEKVAETLGAIQIRLKVKQDSPANAWYRKHGYGYMAFEDGYDWLEKTLEYLKPVKQEWSEEDEKRVKQLIYDTEHIRAEYEKRKKELGESFNDELIKDCDEQIAWLKNLPLSLKKKNEDVAKLCSNGWSEEDEKMAYFVNQFLEFHESSDPTAKSCKK